MSISTRTDIPGCIAEQDAADLQEVEPAADDVEVVQVAATADEDSVEFHETMLCSCLQRQLQMSPGLRTLPSCRVPA